MCNNILYRASMLCRLASRERVQEILEEQKASQMYGMAEPEQTEQ